MSGSCDPESKAIWEDLRSIENQKPCCRLMMQLFASPEPYIYWDGYNFQEKVFIRCCPECGKRLK